nr:hypothetical protein [uncultured Methanomethylovorans sp.]
MGKIKVLILLESVDQVTDFLNRINEIEGEKLVIALTPSVMYELDKNGISYNIPEEYYDPEELFKLGLNNFKIVEDICNMIDLEIQQHIPEFEDLNINPGLFSFYSIKIFYDAITIRIFQLSKITTSESPSVVYVYDSLKYPFGSCASAPYLLFDHKESLYSQLLTLSDWNFSVKMLTNPVRHDNNSCELTTPLFSSTIKAKLKVWLTKHPILYDLALNAQKKGIIGPLYWLSRSLFQKKGLPVLLYGSGYNWDDSYDNLISEGIHPIFRTLDNFDYLNKSSGIAIANLSETWFKLEENSDFKSFFVLTNIDFSVMVKDRFEYLVKQMSVSCLIAIKETMSLIENKRIKAVIASTFSTCVGHSVAQAAHNSYIPVITWQHGGYGMNELHPILSYCDFINSDFHFVFGNGVIDSLQNDAEKYGTVLVSVGSSSLECIAPNGINIVSDRCEEMQILFATTSYLETDTSISTFPPFSDNLFWQTQKSIVDVLGKHPEKSITIKLHPSTTGTHILESYVSDKGYSNFKFIRREKTFPELLQTTDAVIIDLPFTTIVQALMTKKPIFVYTGHVHYNEDAHTLLSKRAICLQDLDDYLSELDTYLNSGVYKADLNNTEFIEIYGLSLKNGSARVKAGQELRKIIEHFVPSKNDYVK